MHFQSEKELQLGVSLQLQIYMATENVASTVLCDTMMGNRPGVVFSSRCSRSTDR